MLYPRKNWSGDQTGLGRVISTEDGRDEKFRLPRSAREATEITSKYWLSRGAPFDQGNTSQCVAYSGRRLLTTHPIVNKDVDPVDLYTQCQRLDQWPGEDYDGTSVRALMRAMKLRGLIGEYRWGTSVEAVVTHLLTRGPVVMGTTWTYSMFTPDRWGYIEPLGVEAGGHAYLLIGANRFKEHPLSGEVGAVRMINSWGSGWGQNGRAWLSFKSLDHLIKDYGEAATVTEIKRII